MNYKDLKQVGVFRRYLLERADRSRSRLMRAQILRWVEQCDAVRFNMRTTEDEKASEHMIRLKAA